MIAGDVTSADPENKRTLTLVKQTGQIPAIWLAGVVKIPAFQPSEWFLEEIEIPCLMATVKNSELPGIAIGYIAENEDDPECEIYLCGKNAGEISAWQREVLEELFEQDGLARAVAEGMREYETSEEWGGNGYEVSPEDGRKIERDGIASHVALNTIVIDDVKQLVILDVDMELDLNLAENGITLYREKGSRWRFDNADYFIQYQEELEYPSESSDEEVDQESGGGGGGFLGKLLAFFLTWSLAVLVVFYFAWKWMRHK